jgi:antitoxin ParD1/3/4
MREGGSLNISLPESMRAWIDQQVKAGGYGTASEFVREVLREAQKARARQELEQKLIAGIESGPPTPMTKADWDRLRRDAEKRAAKRKAR